MSQAFNDDDGVKQHHRSDGGENQVFHKASFLFVIKSSGERANHLPRIVFYFAKIARVRSATRSARTKSGK